MITLIARTTPFTTHAQTVLRCYYSYPPSKCHLKTTRRHEHGQEKTKEEISANLNLMLWKLKFICSNGLIRSLVWSFLLFLANFFFLNFWFLVRAHPF